MDPAPHAAAAAVPAGALTESQTRWQRVQAFRERHARAEIAVFFGAGFAFDVVTLDRIDNWKTLAQQAVYLLVLGLLLLFDLRYRLGGDEPPRGLRWLHRFGGDAVHFLLGSLLSSYALFFFKSASGFSAFAFLLVIFGLLVANELPRFRGMGPVVRLGLYSLSLTAYFAYLLPVVFGRLGWWLFVLAALVSAAPFFLFYRLGARWSGDKVLARNQLAAPAVGVQALLLALYFAGAIPPVPLAVETIGIYHDVKKVVDPTGKPEYELHHERPAWRFWHRGDQRFAHRAGDTVYVFASVFAPMTVAEGNIPISFHWFYDDPKRGWVPKGSWTYGRLKGGRAEGFRVFATKSDPIPGDWRVEIRAPDGREIGRIGFSVVKDDGADPRVFRVERG